MAGRPRGDLLGLVADRDALHRPLSTWLPAANLSNFGLAAGVWTRDISHAHRIASEPQTARSGSTATTFLTPPCPSAASRSRGRGGEMGGDACSQVPEDEWLVWSKPLANSRHLSGWPERALCGEKRQGSRLRGPRTKRATLMISPRARSIATRGVVQFVVDVVRKASSSFAQVLDRCQETSGGDPEGGVRGGVAGVRRFRSRQQGRGAVAWYHRRRWRGVLDRRPVQQIVNALVFQAADRARLWARTGPHCLAVIDALTGLVSESASGSPIAGGAM